MKRMMVWVGLPWMLGLFLATYFGNPLENSLTLCLLPAAWMLLGAVCILCKIKVKRVLCIGISFTAAFCSVICYTLFAYFQVMQHDGTADTFSEKVTSVVTYDNDWASYQVKGKFSDGTKAKILVFTEDVGAEYGDVLDIAGSFSVPESSYLWDGTSYYRAKGIFLETSYDSFVTCTHTENGKLVRVLEKYRERITRRIIALSGTDAGDMVSAMLFGNKSVLTEETKDNFSHNGISHVLSVSGLHLILLLSFWGGLCKRLRVPDIFVFSGSMIWTGLYAILVGTSVTILRAGLMFLLTQSAPLFRRRADTMNLLCIAGVVLTISNPYLIQDASFLLSMFGTFGIGVAAPWMTKRMYRKGSLFRILRSLIEMTCVSVCIFPVTILYFQEVSVITPIANLLLVPIASAMLLLSLFIFLTGGVGFVAKPICFLLHLLYDLLMLLSNGLQQLVPVTFPTGWSLMPALTAILMLFVLLIYVLQRNQRSVAVATAISLVFLLVG